MSDAAARREARRRRILENADNRLKRISNIHRKIESETDETSVAAPVQKVQIRTKPENEEFRAKEVDEAVVNDEEIENVHVKTVVEKSPDSNLKKNEVDYAEKEVDYLDREVDYLEKEVDFLEESAEPLIKTDEVSDCGKSFYGTFIVLLLGLSVRYLNLIFSKFEFFVGIDLSYLHIDKIFLPLLGYECYVLLLARPKYEENVTMNLIMLMNNINGKKLQPLLRVLNLIVSVHKDMAIYFFAFILLDLVLALVSA